MQIDFNLISTTPSDLFFKEDGRTVSTMVWESVGMHLVYYMIFLKGVESINYSDSTYFAYKCLSSCKEMSIFRILCAWKQRFFLFKK